MSNILIFFMIYMITTFSMKGLIIIAKKFDLQEHPNPNLERKIHREPKPYTASLGIFVIFWGFIIVSFIVKGSWLISPVILLGALLLFLVSFIDDYFKIKGKSFPVAPRFLTHIISAVIIYSQGVRFEIITNPFNGELIVFTGWISFILTLLWIVGLINVINFIDGIDGLAGGVTSIVASTLMVVAISQSSNDMVVLTTVLVAVCIGYVRHNRYPSKILMGDAGATGLGYIIAVLSLMGVFKQATVISVAVPVLALGVPIFDNIGVVIGRILRKQAPYEADDTQLHFRLRKLGLHDRFVTAFILLMTSVLSLVSLVIYFAVQV
ncbi:MAG: undecaprenyl/decaprenyl-phosphate alpha-N-acetylglucosaminyl 1-phosphate transferase [Clostridia bacterium]|nr:undecaprenyl/decaprenyl-phosphate alpha-N-acetylglucosaminyl 1-phosphate transferase [Clostridia bacterium]